MAKNKKLIAGTLLAGAVSLIGSLEGVRYYAYPDPATYGAPYTVCYGETQGVKLHHRYAPAECSAMLAKALKDRYGAGVNSCLKEPDKVPVKPFQSFMSFAYNEGVGGFCHSDVAREANAGNIKAACEAIAQRKYAYAAHKFNQGLWNRRLKEKAWCLSGL